MAASEGDGSVKHRNKSDFVIDQATEQRLRMAELDAACSDIVRPLPLWPIAAFIAITATVAMVLASQAGVI